jgi:Tfp pilus assembly protein PilF
MREPSPIFKLLAPGRGRHGWVFTAGGLAVWLALAANLCGQSNGIVRGRIMDPQGAAENISVRLIADGEVPVGYTYTDSDGHYIFQQLEGGTYFVIVEVDGYRPVRERAMLDMQFEPKATVNITLEPLRKDAEPPSPVIAGSTSSQKLDAKRPAAPFSPKVLREFEKGNKAQQNGDLATALAHFRKALALDPNFYPALNNEGTLLERQGNHTAAALAFSKAAKINPDDSEAYINLGHVLYEEGKYHDAIQQLELGLQRSPNSATGNFFLGSAYFKLQNEDKAEALLRRACELDSEHLPAAHLQLANLYLKRREYAAARVQLETYLRQNPSDPQAPAIKKKLASLSGQ